MITARIFFHCDSDRIGFIPPVFDFSRIARRRKWKARAPSDDAHPEEHEAGAGVTQSPQLQIIASVTYTGPYDHPEK